jgi:hypothetical protein
MLPALAPCAAQACRRRLRLAEKLRHHSSLCDWSHLDNGPYPSSPPPAAFLEAVSAPVQLSCPTRSTSQADRRQSIETKCPSGLYAFYKAPGQAPGLNLPILGPKRHHRRRSLLRSHSTAPFSPFNRSLCGRSGCLDCCSARLSAAIPPPGSRSPHSTAQFAPAAAQTAAAALPSRPRLSLLRRCARGCVLSDQSAGFFFFVFLFLLFREPFPSHTIAQAAASSFSRRVPLAGRASTPSVQNVPPHRPHLRVRPCGLGRLCLLRQVQDHRPGVRPRGRQDQAGQARNQV